jgi:hypothetical protein
MNVQRRLDLQETEPTEQQLRAAHKRLRIPSQYEDWMARPWGPPLLRGAARCYARSAGRKARTR